MSHLPAPPVSRPRRLLRFVYHAFWYSLAALVILVAIALSAMRVFLPDLKSYREDIEQFASEAMGRTVQIATMDAKLDGLTPTFIFTDVRLLDRESSRQILRIEQARLGFDLLRSFYSGKAVPSSLTISGIDLVITRRKTGALTIQGLDLANLEKELAEKQETVMPESDELSRWLFERSRLSIENSRVTWRDYQHEGKPVQLDNVNLKLRNDKLRHQLTGKILLPASLGEELEFAVDFKGNILVPLEWEGDVYVRGKAIQTNNWGMKPSIMHVTLHEGEAEYQTWGHWTPRGFDALVGSVTLSNVRLTTKNIVEPFKLKLLNAKYDWRRNAAGWQLRVADFQYQQADEVWPATSFEASLVEGEQPVVTLHSSLLRLPDLRNLLTHSGLMDKPSLKLLVDHQPRGELHDLFVQARLVDGTAKEVTVHTRFEQLAVNPAGNFPGMSGISGSVWLDEQHGQLTIDSRNATLEFKKLFRQPFDMTQLQAEVHWSHQGNDWHVQAPRVTAVTADMSTVSAMYLVLPGQGQSPFLDLQTHYSGGNIAAAGRYLPVTIMEKDLVSWLDNGLVAGKLADGGLVLHGRLADFPYRDGTGTFEARFAAADVELNYSPAWPHFTRMQLDGHFTGTRMTLHAASAALFDSQLQDVTVAIEDFSRAVLRAKGQYVGSTRDIIHFLVDSAIAPEAKDFYANSRFTGESRASLDLQLPLNPAADDEYPLHYAGKVTFNDATMSSWDGMLEVRKLNGELEYSTAGVSGKGITAEIFGGKTDVTVFTHPMDDSQQIKVGLSGVLDMAAVLGHFKLPLTDKLNGRTTWAGLLAFGYHAGERSIPGSFTFDSNLKGVRVDLPPPLGKNSDYARHVSLQFEFPRDDQFMLAAEIENEVRGKLVLDTRVPGQVKLHKAALNFSVAEPVLPVHSAIRIGGTLAEFAPEAWHNVLPPAKPGISNTLPDFGNLAMPLELDMDYLSIVTSDNEPAGPPPLPAELPVVSGVIRELKVDGMQLGKFEIASERDPDGIRFRKIQFDTEDMHIRGEGSWLYRKKQHQTNVLLELESPNVSNMLHRLGYAGVINHGKARAHMQASWADAPDRFEFAKLNGNYGVVVTEGSIVAVEPGAGRLLGLLSLTELPRHMMLNFKEFRSGLSFDEIKGSFEITDGNAVTNDLNVTSPVAIISVRGRTGFATRDYDLNVVGVPRVTSSVALISCLLTGGSTCVGGFFFDRIFGKSLDDSLATRYRVTGTWEKPVITEVKSKVVSPVSDS